VCDSLLGTEKVFMKNSPGSGMMAEAPAGRTREALRDLRQLAELQKNKNALMVRLQRPRRAVGDGGFDGRRGPPVTRNRTDAWDRRSSIDY